jgi:hypothetical protein
MCFWVCAVFLLGLPYSLPLDPAAAYIVTPPMTLGKMVAQSTQIIVVKVEKVDQDKNVIVWKKIREIKGKWPSDLITHRLGVETRDKPLTDARQYVMAWAKEGKTTILFHIATTTGRTPTSTSSGIAAPAPTGSGGT